LIQKNQNCGSSGCHIKIEYIGIDCRFCGARFCMKHAIAEEHGCTHAAQVDARRSFIDGYERILRPFKPLKADQKDYLSTKLHQKVVEQRKARQPAQKKPEKD